MAFAKRVPALPVPPPPDKIILELSIREARLISQMLYHTAMYPSVRHLQTVLQNVDISPNLGLLEGKLEFTTLAKDVELDKL